MFSRNQAFCMKNIKLWQAPTTIRVQHFLLKLCTGFLLTNVYKRLFEIFFLFCLDLELYAKIKKDLVSTHSLFTFLLITQDLNKIKKPPKTLLLTFLSMKHVQNFSKRFQQFVVVGADQIFQFFRQIAWLLTNFA